MVICATGALPIIPHIDGINSENIVLAEDVLMEKVSVGQNVAVIGGGAIGVETAELLATNGKTVSVIEMKEQLLAELPLALSYKLLMRTAMNQNISVYTNEKVECFGNDSVKTDKQTISDLNNVILALGYSSNTELMKKLESTGIPCIAVGDAVAARRIHQAIHEGFESVYNL